MSQLRKRGSDLTEREEVVYFLPDLNADPSLRTEWKEWLKFEALKAECVDLLKSHDLPWCPNSHVLFEDGTWQCLSGSYKSLTPPGYVKTSLGPVAYNWPEDSAPEIAARLLRVGLPRYWSKLKKLSDAPDACSEEDLLRLVQAAHHIGVLQERMFWKRQHERAAVDQYRHRGNQADGRNRAASGKRAARQYRLNVMAAAICSSTSPEWRKCQSNAQLARLFGRALLPGLIKAGGINDGPQFSDNLEVLSRYVSELRKTGVLEPKDGKQKKSD